MTPKIKSKSKSKIKGKRCLLFDKPPSAESSETEEQQQQHEKEQTPFVIKPIEEDKQQQQLESGEEEDEQEQEEEDEEDKKPKKKRPVTDSATESSTDSHPALKKPKKVISPIVKESSKAAKTGKKTEEEEKSVNAKTTTDVVEEDEDDLEEKKGSIIRLWSLNDELVVLQAMIDFKEENNKDPASYRDDFFNFVKGKLNDRKFTKVQLMDKVRRLKKKYTTNLNKSSATGKDPTFSNPHELKSFQLSKRIWAHLDANNNNNNNINSSNAKVVEDDMMKVDEEEKKGMVEKGVLNKSEDTEKVYPYLMKAFEGESSPKVLMFDAFKTCLSNVDSVLLKEWDSKWKKVCIAETDAYISRLALIQEQTNWFYNQMKSSKD